MKFIAILMGVIIFLFGTFLVIISTANKAHLSPNTLPVAYVNEPYQAKIEIIGGAVIPESLHYEISDKDFQLQPKIDTFIDTSDNNKVVSHKDYHELTLKGTPTTLTPIKVHISGWTYGTNFSGKEFEKTYTIEVKTKN